MRAFKFKRTGLTLLFWCALTSLSYGQKFNLTNYSTKDGLSSQNVNNIFEDDKGYIWFATQSGVCYYNGSEFVDFIPDEILNSIDAVFVKQDKSGRIWIGTNADGLFIYDFKKITHYSEKNGLPSNIVRSLFFDKDNTPWILTSNGVAKLVNNKIITVIDPKKKFADGVLSMTQTADGTYWFGSQGNGLIKLKKDIYSYNVGKSDIIDDYIFSMNASGDSIYIGTTNQGLIIGYNNQFNKAPLPALKDAWISNVIPQKDRLCIISSSGLFYYNYDCEYSQVTEANGITSNDLYHGMLDREGNFWLASGVGVSCLRHENLITYDEDSGLSDVKTTILYKLKDGRIIIGTYGNGINIIEKSGEIKHIENPALDNIRITALLENTDKNELWVGAENSDEGIIILDTEYSQFTVKRTIKTIKKLPLQTVTKIDIDKQGNTWVSTFNAGLFKINQGDTTIYNASNLLPSDEVYTFYIDNKDDVWISLYQKGVYKLVGNKISNISKSLGLKEKVVLAINQDSKGNIYFGNKTRGLTIIDNKNNVQEFTKLNGLLSNSISTINIDENSIWCGTSKGLNKLKLNGNKVLLLESYNERNGLINPEIEENGLLVISNQVWIASSTGLSSLEISTNTSTPEPSKMEVQSIKLFFQARDWTTKEALSHNQWGVPTSLNLNYKQNHLTFQFNTLTANPVTYSVMLEGIDNTWSPYSDLKEVTYSSILPGNYTFRVRSIDAYGHESIELSIPIQINPAIWNRWWFRLLFVLILSAIIYYYIQHRIKKFKEQRIKLEQIVKERTNEAVKATELAEKQKDIVELKNKEIIDSIEYAQRIQSAIFPSKPSLEAAFENHFIYYQPKDIVAGDFYWHLTRDNCELIAVADCTGHGVPGALMSVFCYNALNKAVNQFNLTTPSDILDKTREIILQELAKNDVNMKDGMDISLASIDKANNKIEWAGANSPIWIFKSDSDETFETKGDKQPIGAHIEYKPYVNHTITIEKNDLVVLFTDGYIDQFGGERGKKFMSSRFKKLFIECKSKSMKEIEANVSETFQEWKSAEEQVDDVCVFAYRHI